MPEEIINNQQPNTDAAQPTADGLLAAFWAQADARAAQLSTQYQRNVLPVSLRGDDENDHVLGFMYEMDGMTDVRLASAKISGPEVSMPKAVQALESLMLYNDSDPRYREKKYMNGAALYLLSLVEIALPEVKKK